MADFELVGATGFEPVTPCAQGIDYKIAKCLILNILILNSLQNHYWKLVCLLAALGNWQLQNYLQHKNN
jgi:hypothetical protein